MDALLRLVHGAMLCGMLKYRLISHKFECGELQCPPSYRWPAYSNIAPNASLPLIGRRVVLSYGHNGFGNQLFQHSFGLMLASLFNGYNNGSLGSQSMFYVDTIQIEPVVPVNTNEGALIMDLIVPEGNKYYALVRRYVPTVPLFISFIHNM